MLYYNFYKNLVANYNIAVFYHYTGILFVKY